MAKLTDDPLVARRQLEHSLDITVMINCTGCDAGETSDFYDTREAARAWFDEGWRPDSEGYAYCPDCVKVETSERKEG